MKLLKSLLIHEIVNKLSVHISKYKIKKNLPKKDFDSNEPTSPEMYFFEKNCAYSAKVIDTDLIHVDSKRLIKGKKHC